MYISALKRSRGCAIGT